MWDFLITFVLFAVTLFALPLIGFGFIVLKISRSLWLSCISTLHPDMDFVKYVTVRSLLDTHRNQGIISVLLSVKGQARPEAVKRHLQEVVRRRDKSGNLVFLRLRHLLVTKCGTYAWQREKFDLEQNVTVAPFTFKGRAVTEFNIQEYVSDIITKYLPSNIPPWQVVIIPSSEDHHYILLKLHHLLLSEGINIGDLLPLIPPTRQATGSYVSKSPLVEVFRKPQVIPVLKERLADELSNRWNEFVANYDPLERPELLKSTPSFPQFIAIVVISLISIIKDSKKGFRVIKTDVFSRTKYILLTAAREADKRQVNVSTLVLSIMNSLDPRNLARNILRSVFYMGFVLPLRLPIVLYAEFKALYTCLTLHYCPYPYTFTGITYIYVPLIYNSLREILYICSILFAAPKTIIQDILLQDESLQTITLCGRKSVAWSDPVPIDHIKTVAKQTGASVTEIMLSAVSMGLSKYFSQTGQEIPTDLPITMRNISSNYIFATGHNIKPEDAVSGLVCLNLAIPNPAKETTHIENLLEIKSKFSACLEKQGLSHLLTMLQTKFRILTQFLPSTLLSVYLKYLSRKYAVSVTEITSRYPNVTQRTLWGQEVKSVVYWRPPQANTSISLCLNEYADHVKLGVMCDAQLVPHHVCLVRSFPKFIKDLGEAATV
ncbi:hypothetical protein JTB14_009812 [Gonioctena quinquepunctata]|nr:hypothetical protein JTB14_009812 [Gonioctena quinquepunctata]